MVLQRNIRIVIRLHNSAFKGICGEVVKVIHFKSLAFGWNIARDFETLNIVYMYFMSVVLLRCLLVPEIVHRGSSWVFHHQ
jgi:hypothetical protein